MEPLQSVELSWRGEARCNWWLSLTSYSLFEGFEPGTQVLAAIKKVLIYGGDMGLALIFSMLIGFTKCFQLLQTSQTSKPPASFSVVMIY